MVKELIITADDYGMSTSVNTAIEECIVAGTVLSTSVMTTMLDCERASQLRQRFPGVSVGIHWTLTQGRPVLEQAIIPSLINSHGRFISACSSDFRKRFLIGKISKEEIRKELIAQYWRFRELAGTPDYWNTHENLHVWPTLFQLITKVGKELGIGRMRNNVRVTVPYRGTAKQYNLNHLIHYLKGQLISRFSNWARREGMAMPAGLIYLPDFPGGQTDIEDAIQRISWPKIPAPLELIIHPATQIETGLFGNLTECRIEEYHYFAQPDVADRLQRLGVRLVGI